MLISLISKKWIIKGLFFMLHSLLIATVGGSPSPVIASLIHYKPSKIIFWISLHEIFRCSFLNDKNKLLTPEYPSFRIDQIWSIFLQV